MKKVLEQKLADAQGKFNQLNDRRKTLVEQRANLDRQIAIIVEEQTMLRGDFRTIEGLIAEQPKEEKKKKKE